ncbi:MAG: Membrane-bound metallopeptidase [Bacteroidetes bacterium]|nr:Membrane-bound metallopeptidase [Bacteroidota bacterium]
MRYALILLLSALAVLPVPAGVQDADDEIRKRQVELEKLRDQIKTYEERIARQAKTESATLELLDSYDKKGTLLRRLLSQLRRQEAELQKTIGATRASLDALGTELQFLRDQYARSVVAAYTGGPERDIELLLASRSLNQASIRNEYLKRFAAQRKADVGRILTKRAEIEEVKARAQQELTEERRLIAEKGAEEERLASLAEDRRTLLGRIRRDRSQLQREIERKNRAARDLEDMITRLIENERVREERAREEAKTPPPPVPPGTGFDARKGRLRWPVTEGRVVARFGNQRHPTLKTVTQNTGIDIAVKAGSPVLAVARGEVATIWWLPSFGNLVILNHYGGYRTVYSHLAEIHVVEGQEISEGEVIGESGESVDGPRLHFEIWKGKEKQNPESWLADR